MACGGRSREEELRAHDRYREAFRENECKVDCGPVHSLKEFAYWSSSSAIDLGHGKHDQPSGRWIRDGGSICGHSEIQITFPGGEGKTHDLLVQLLRDTMAALGVYIQQDSPKNGIFINFNKDDENRTGGNIQINLGTNGETSHHCATMMHAPVDISSASYRAVTLASALPMIETYSRAIREATELDMDEDFSSDTRTANDLFLKGCSELADSGWRGAGRTRDGSPLVENFGLIVDGEFGSLAIPEWVKSQWRNCFSGSYPLALDRIELNRQQEFSSGSGDHHSSTVALLNSIRSSSRRIDGTSRVSDAVIMKAFYDDLVRIYEGRVVEAADHLVGALTSALARAGRDNHPHKRHRDDVPV